MVSGGVVGGVVVANAAAGSSSSSSGSSATSPAQPPAGGFDPTKAGHVGANGVTEVLLTGDTATKVRAAAQAAGAGGTIERVETDAEGSPYEAHMVRSDGTHVTVKVDGSFKVTAVETDQMPAGGPGGATGASTSTPEPDPRSLTHATAGPFARWPGCHFITLYRRRLSLCTPECSCGTRVFGSCPLLFPQLVHRELVGRGA